MNKSRYIVHFLIFLAMATGAQAQTTAPTGSADRDQQLERQIAELKTANASLRVANNALQRRVYALEHPTTAKPAAERRVPYHGETFETRTNAFFSSAMGRRFTVQDHESTVADARKIDQQIAKYVRGKNISAEREAQLYEGKVSLGMTPEELKIIGDISVKDETAGVQIYAVTVWEPVNAPTIDVTVSDGKVSEIDHSQYQQFHAEEANPGHMPSR